MKKLIPSIAVAGLSAISFAGSAFAVPVVTAGTVPTECAILNVEPGVLKFETQLIISDR
ncbi:hypothetical protein [Chamaesiphon sp. GL140_3_metabinner_50]|uniref:hypothetical protein n=1 Tax=Chamaesiphon sp. GL140_3_metabinner_50 TaxID=2970812 RepID=UPI0025DD2E75|nr:hypothetical protein [Chamaesiphon sp. GL140_3_metabinner_50]